MQAVRVTTVHVPDATQHAPIGCGQLAVGQTVPLPAKAPGQLMLSITEQPPSKKQHAPIWGCEQGEPSGMHVWPESQLLVEAQLICATIEQAPVPGLQHAPSGGCVHGERPSGPQTWPIVHRLPDAQLIAMVLVQRPVSVLQHVPAGGCGQGLGEQDVTPCVQVVLVPEHWNCTLITQTPEAALQQEPKTGCGQVLGEQVVIVETHWLLPVQNCWSVSEQVLAVMPQHAPMGQGVGEQAVTPVIQILGEVHAA